MAGAPALIVERDEDDGSVIQPGPENTNGLANIGEMAPPTDSRPGPRANERDKQYEIVDADDAGRPIQGRQPTEAPLDDENAGDGTLLEQRRRQQAEQTGEQRERQPRRETRAQRHAREREGRDRTMAENARLRAQLEELRQQVNGLEPRLAEIDQGRVQERAANIDRQIQQQSELVNRAYQQFAEATTSGDQAAIRAAMEARDQAFLRSQQLAVEKNMLLSGNPLGDPSLGRLRGNQQEARQQGPAAPPPMSREVRERVEQFSEDHPWYRPDDRAPNGAVRDLDTRIMLELDSAVANDGFDPRTPDYWEELEDRAKQYLPHRFQTSQRAASRAPLDAEPEERIGRSFGGNITPQGVIAQPRQTERRGPPVAGGSDRGPSSGPTRVYLSPGRKDALIQAGALERDGKTVANKEIFQRKMKYYEQYDRDNGAGVQ